MAFRLTKTEAERLAALQLQLRRDREAITAEFDLLVQALAALPSAVNGLIESYNRRLALLRGFADEIAQCMRDQHDEKSERWQEGEAGQAALAFVEAWEEVHLNDVEPVAILAPDPLALAPLNDLDLPTEAE